MPQASLSLAVAAVVDDPRAVCESQVATLAGLYEERLRLTPDAVACRWRDPAADDGWKQVSWREIQASMLRYQAGLHRAGLVAGDRVAVQASNGPVWLAIDWAVQSLGLVMVGLYNEDTPGNTAYLIAHSGARLAFLRDTASWQGASSVQAFEALEQVVILGGEAPPADAAGAAIRPLDAWLPPKGTPRCVVAGPTDPEALATIVYTSGSTGLSHGVMLSHRNLLANIFACRRALTATADDTFFSLLPLTNLFERTTGAYGAIVAGAVTVYARGAAQLAEDLLAARPTVLIAVPRVFERLHGNLLAELDRASPTRRAMFRLAVQAGWAVRQHGPGKRPIANAITRRAQAQFAARLGGRLRVAISGGAPLAPEIARTFIALGLPLLQGYGLTEVGPVVSVNRLGDNDPHSVGLPLDNVETRLGPDNELLVRSPALMQGYWRDEQASARAIDDAGWLHTGDKVSRLEAHRLYLVGRIKEVIVTSTGRKIAPSEIEQCLLADPLVNQVMVVGEARPFLGALIVPHADRLPALRAELGLADDDDSPQALAQIEAEVLRRCCEHLRHTDTSCTLRQVALVGPCWTVANGLLTPTLKLRRAAVARQHAADIERLYDGHFLPARTDCSCNAGV